MNWRKAVSFKSVELPWLDSIPDEWGIGTIRHLAYLKARIGWQNLRSDEFVDEGPYCVTGTDFREGRVNWNTCYRVSEQRYEIDPYIQLKKGDLLVTKDGSIGKLALVDDLPGPATLNSGVFVVRPVDGKFQNRFLFWVLASKIFEAFVSYMAGGTTINHLYQNVFGRFAFPLPTPDEQEQIAAFLNRETARIDALIEKKRRLLELLEEKRLAVITQAVTKGLDPNVSMKGSGIDWLGEVPAHWNVARVKFIAKLESGHTPSKSVPEYWEDCDIPWVSLNDSKYLAKNDYISETTYQINRKGLEGSSARLLPAGAVVFTRDATIGLAAITTREMAVSQHLIAWLPYTRISSLYLLRVFDVMKRKLDSITFGATIKTIGMDDVKKLVAPIPPIDEQCAICGYIEEQKAAIDNLVESVQSAVQKLLEYRSALISNAVTGKIDVRSLIEKEKAA